MVFLLVFWRVVLLTLCLSWLLYAKAKQDDLSNPSNYRLVPLTPIISAVFQSLLNSYFRKGLESQFFSPTTSTVLARWDPLVIYCLMLLMSDHPLWEFLGNPMLQPLIISKAFDRSGIGVCFPSFPLSAFFPLTVESCPASSRVGPLPSSLMDQLLLSLLTSSSFLPTTFSWANYQFYSYVDSTLHSSNSFKSNPSSLAHSTSRHNYFSKFGNETDLPVWQT